MRERQREREEGMDRGRERGREGGRERGAACVIQRDQATKSAGLAGSR